MRDELTLSGDDSRGKSTMQSAWLAQLLWDAYYEQSQAKLLGGVIEPICIPLPEKMHGRPSMDGHPEDLAGVRFRVSIWSGYTADHREVHLQAEVDGIPFMVNSAIFQETLRGKLQSSLPQRFKKNAEKLYFAVQDRLQHLQLLRKLRDKHEELRGCPEFEADLLAECRAQNSYIIYEYQGYAGVIRWLDYIDSWRMNHPEVYRAWTAGH